MTRTKSGFFMLLAVNFAIVFLLVSGFAVDANAQGDVNPDILKELTYRYIGPDGNRVIAVIGEPGNPNVIYAGAASGGIFKSTDSGINWDPIFDDQDAMSIGSLAMAPSDYNIIWAGTGETFIRSNVSIGNGIYKSTDAGKTWQHMGLDLTGRIGRILIHPRNPDVVYAAALGHSYGPQQERGVYRTTDGGETWERVLFVDENTGASDIAIDPGNPLNIIAGMWPLEMKTWVRNSGGPNGGLYLSRDGGTTWKKLTKGLPEPPIGKVGVAYAPSNPDRIYAVIETDQEKEAGVLWRSDDGGENWNLISHDHSYTQRPHYYSRIAVAIDNEDEVYFIAQALRKSTDGGKTAVTMRGGDNHDMWIDPLIPDRMIIGNDHNPQISINRGKTWYAPQLPIGQMYHVATDNQIPYFVYGSLQDGGSRRGPSNSLTGGRIPISMWRSVGGGESGFSYPDPVDNNIVWGASYDGRLSRYDSRTGHTRNNRPWPDAPTGAPPTNLKYRWNWTLPIAISPHDHNKVYVGSQYVHVTTNGGQSWQVISPDLTLNDKSKLVPSGGLTTDNIGVDFGSTLFAITESTLENGLIWAGSNDGLVHVTRNGGEVWINVTGNIPNMPEWGIISNIEPSRFDAGTAYISVKYHRMNNRDPYVYKTNDYGQSWELITADIPRSMFSYVHVIKEDPGRKGLLYLGTENALYVSFNDGRDWLLLQNNLPHAPVHWLEIQEHFSDLVVATYGRGFWIMDDITPIRQLNDTVLRSDAHLFKPRAAYRFQNVSQPASIRTPADGSNPEYGASINYYLKEIPEDTVTIALLDESGRTVRTLAGTKNKGINRVMWDLRHEHATEAHVRTPPLGFPSIDFLPLRLRLGEKRWRPLVVWGNGSGEAVNGPRVVPGTYTVRLTVGGRSFTEALEVRKDPNTDATLEDIRKQVTLGLEIHADISEVVGMINAIEWTRKQIDDLIPLLKEDNSLAPLIDAAEELDRKSIDVEKFLFELRLQSSGSEENRKPIQIYSKLLILFNVVQSADYPPTDQHYEVYEMYTGMLADYRNRYNDLMNNELLRFNEKLRDQNLLNIVVPKK